MCLNRNVNCEDIWSTLKTKFSAFMSSVTNTFNDIYGRVKKAFILEPYVISQARFTTPQKLEEKNYRQTFHDFIETIRTTTEAQSSEYIRMGSEPTALMSTSQLASHHGRKVESHVIETKDGYLLTIHRVLNSWPPIKSKFTNETVLLHHGLLGSSADWLLLGPEKSLPYILSDAGYDVWMANSRGNCYSRDHVSKVTQTSKTYWKFTWQEIGEYDLPAVIDYVRNIKNSTEKINFVGHSMGATALLVLLSTHPRYNQYLRIGILLAPLVFMTNIKGPFDVISNMSTDPPDHLLRTIGTGEFIPSRKVPKSIASKFCKGPRIYCNNPLLFLTGWKDKIVTDDPSFISRLLYHVPAGGSTNTILHYGQIVKNGKFHRFGKNSSEFPLHQATLPIVLFSSDADWLATVPNVLRLYLSISNPIDIYVIRNQNFSHTEFVWGTDANVYVFPKLLDYLENGLNVTLVKENEISTD